MNKAMAIRDVFRYPDVGLAARCCTCVSCFVCFTMRRASRAWGLLLMMAAAAVLFWGVVGLFGLSGRLGVRSDGQVLRGSRGAGRTAKRDKARERRGEATGRQTLRK